MLTTASLLHNASSLPSLRKELQTILLQYTCVFSYCEVYLQEYSAGYCVELTNTYVLLSVF